MKFIKSIISIVALLSFSGVSAQDEYVRGEDPQADAIRDMQMGMGGLQQAAKDPVLMAQLMKDLQVKDSSTYPIRWAYETMITLLYKCTHDCFPRLFFHFGI